MELKNIIKKNIINIYGVELYFIPNKNKCKKFGELNIITGKYTYERLNM